MSKRTFSPLLNTDPTNNNFLKYPCKSIYSDSRKINNVIYLFYLSVRNFDTEAMKNI